MSPMVFTKYPNQKEVTWQQYRLYLAIAGYRILGGKHVLILGPESGKIWWLKTVQYVQKKYHCQWTLLRSNQPKWMFQFGKSFTTTLSSYQPLFSIWFQRNGKSEQSWRLVISIRATASAKNADQWLPGSCKFECERGSNIGHELDWEPTWRVESFRTLHWPLWQARLCAVNRKIWLLMFCTPLTIASHCAQGNDWSFAGIHRHLQRIFPRIWQFFDVIFLPNMHFPSAAWFPLLGYSSGKPVQDQLAWLFVLHPNSFFSAAFDPRVWTMVVFGKEDSGRQPQLITLENEGGDGTN